MKGQEGTDVPTQIILSSPKENMLAPAKIKITIIYFFSIKIKCKSDNSNWHCVSYHNRNICEDMTQYDFSFPLCFLHISSLLNLSSANINQNVRTALTQQIMARLWDVLVYICLFWFHLGINMNNTNCTNTWMRRKLKQILLCYYGINQWYMAH